MLTVVLVLLLDRVICQVNREIRVIQSVRVGGYHDVALFKQKKIKSYDPA